ncbi:hypothetical protein [Pedobacter immunditicola]|uniref:hypothetical protein n=1 Tax=Pedobacter immunditicola TaxID=3133440 RepID=UPI0030A2DA55
MKKLLYLTIALFAALSTKVMHRKQAILLNRITLLAVVEDNEVTNPFTVTEVYQKENNSWKLASMSFTRLMTR